MAKGTESNSGDLGSIYCLSTNFLQTLRKLLDRFLAVVHIPYCGKIYPCEIWLLWYLNILINSLRGTSIRQDCVELGNRYIQPSKAESDGGKNNLIYVWCVYKKPSLARALEGTCKDHQVQLLPAATTSHGPARSVEFYQSGFCIMMHTPTDHVRILLCQALLAEVEHCNGAWSNVGLVLCLSKR